MTYELPTGRFLEDILGFQGLFDIVHSLGEEIAKEYDIDLLNNEAYEYPVNKDDYDLLKKELTEILKKEGLNVKFENGIVYFSTWIRIPRTTVISELKDGKLANKIRKHFETMIPFGEESFLVYPATSTFGIAQKKGSKRYYRYFVSDDRKQPEMIVNMWEQLYVLAFEAIINWFIREFLKRNLNSECFLRSVEIEKLDYSPSKALTAEEVDELLLTFYVTIEVDGEERRYRVETSNWIQKEIKEI